MIRFRASHRPILRAMQARATNAAARYAPRPQVIYTGAQASRSSQQRTQGCSSCQKAKAAGLALYRAHVTR